MAEEKIYEETAAVEEEAKALDAAASHQQFEEDIEKALELLRNGDYRDTRSLLLSYKEADIAEILEEILDEIGVDKAIIAFRMLPKNVAVEVFSRLDPDDQLTIIDGITEIEIAYIMDEMDLDDKINVL